MISIQLPDHLEQQLIRFAHQTHKSNTEVIKLALMRLFESEQTTETEGQRVLNMLTQNGLLGSISAESDLSVNYKSQLDWHHKT